MPMRTNKSKSGSIDKVILNTLQKEAIAEVRSALSANGSKGRSASRPIFSDKWSVIGDDSNPMKAFLTIKDAEGALITMSHSAVGSYTIAAANVCRVELILDIGAYIISKASDQKGYPFFKCFQRQMSFWSTAAFMVTPFLVVLENGETITAHNDTSVDLEVGIEASLGAGDFALALGPTFSSKGLIDNGTRRHKCDMIADLMEVSNWFSRYYAQTEIDEHTSKVLQLGFHVCGVASQVINVDDHTINAYYLKSRII